jgi:UPF0042 nucleotide-binding protein
MDFLIVTGQSGAGKSQAMHALEDLGYFCIDNIPPEMLERFFEICLRSDKDGRFAAVADIRSRAMFGDLLAVRKKLSAFKSNTRLLYLDASDEVLLRRFKETRRRHPLMIDTACSLQDAITLERQILGDVRESADYVVDTSHLTGGQLKERIAQLFGASMSGMMASKSCRSALNSASPRTRICCSTCAACPIRFTSRSFGR